MADKKSLTRQQNDFISLSEALASAHHRFSLFDAGFHRLSGSGLTAPQAKVIFCLGATEGLPCSEITNQTLITKGTLTGVLDRLEEKGLIQRWGDEEDGRKIIVDLTRSGQKLYEREYSKYIKFLQSPFSGLAARDVAQATAVLKKIAALF